APCCTRWARGGTPRSSPGRGGTRVDAVNACLTLCLDTSDGVSAALAQHGRTAAARSSSERHRHVETLTPLIAECLQQLGATPADMHGEAAGTGPAPFTGLRVGLVTARTLAQARDIPLYGVSCLDAIAAAAFAQEAARPGTELLITTDARRREIYWGRYRATGTDIETVAGPDVGEPAQVAAEHADLIAAGAARGRGVGLYPQHLAPGADDQQIQEAAAHGVEAAVLGHLALHRAAAGQDQPARALYLRLPDV